MMVKSLKKFGGAIMLYLVIFFGIVAICSSYELLGIIIKNEVVH